MRLLIVTWLYEPHATPRAIRWKTVAREFVRMGYEVDVVTSRAAGESSFEIVSGVRIHRCGGSVATRLSSFSKDEGAGQWLKTLHEATWKKIYWPDKACLWILPAIRTAQRLLRANRYDGLITVSLPFSAHVIGDRLKRGHPNLPWLADVGDPFSCQDDSAPNNVQLHRERNRTWEGRVFAKADRVAVTNESMAQVFATLFSESGNKFVVIPPVLGSDVRATGSIAHAGMPRILFLGTLYRKIRNPRYLLSAFKRLAQDYELHFIGDLNDCADLIAAAQRNLGGSLKIHASQTRQQAMRSLAEADFVVNIGNSTPFQLPSKLVEYVAMGKHIINVSSCPQDSSALFLGGYPGVVQLNETDVPTEKDMDMLGDFLRNPPAIPAAQIEPWIHRSSPGNVAIAYLAGLGLRPHLQRAA